MLLPRGLPTVALHCQLNGIVTALHGILQESSSVGGLISNKREGEREKKPAKLRCDHHIVHVRAIKTSGDEHERATDRMDGRGLGGSGAMRMELDGNERVRGHDVVVCCIQVWEPRKPLHVGISMLFHSSSCLNGVELN